MTNRTTLDKALEAFDEEPNGHTVGTLLVIASEYLTDGMIEKEEFETIIKKARNYLNQ